MCVSVNFYYLSTVIEGHTVKINIFDMAGQPFFYEVRQDMGMFMRCRIVCIICKVMQNQFLLKGIILYRLSILPE